MAPLRIFKNDSKIFKLCTKNFSKRLKGEEEEDKELDANDDENQKFKLSGASLL